MPKFQEVVIVPYGDWIELTDGDVSAVTFQVLEGPVFIRRGDDVKPDSTATGWVYQSEQGERGLALDDLSKSPGARVWARGSRVAGSMVMVDHA
ncbi:hypothetical protein [Epibacterium ulvae]|uniref:hypothetical protein n=1 Tax=Epibacterium ulvae TaxID=1156985 RepID=UPI00249208FD|nr:hypothetical protein [Epibacterium ulvae]